MMIITVVLLITSSKKLFHMCSLMGHFKIKPYIIYSTNSKEFEPNYFLLTTKINIDLVNDH